MSIKYRALVITFLELVQELDDAAIDCYVKFRLPNAEGEILQWLGDRVGQRQEGRSDADFKTAITARILVNRSNGTREQILKIASLFATVVDIQAGGGVVFLDLGYVPQAKAQEVFNFVRDALETTVRLQVKYCPSPVDDTFTVANGTCTTAIPGGFSSTLQVASTANFPSAGEVVIAVGTASEQTLSYTSKTLTVLSGFSGSLNAHEVGSTVSLVTTGLGYGSGHYATTIEG